MKTHPMSRLFRRLVFRHSFIVVGVLTAAPAVASAQQDDDPFVWLEDVEGKRSLDWVNQHNSATLADLSANPVYKPIYDRILTIINSRNRIAFPTMRSGMIYNFWQDANNQRGLYRRTTLDSYLTDNPQWETVLDIDALAAAEKKNWAYKGMSCLAPENRLCLVSLSNGGADAVEVREFDLNTKQFVKDGFFVPDAKQTIGWVDANTLLIGTNFGEGSMTTSGYARVIKLWKRGTPLSTATTVMEGAATDMGLSAFSFLNGDSLIKMIQLRPAFFDAKTWIYNGGNLQLLDIPTDADFDVLGDQLIVSLKKDWTVGGKPWSSGSLISTSLAAFLKGKIGFQLVLKPGERESILSTSTTRDYLLVAMLNNVRGQLRRYQHKNGAWTYDAVPAPEMGSIGVVATTPADNSYFFSYSGFTQPATLYYVDNSGKSREAKRMPEMYDAKGLTVEQSEATSTDGTRIPYFIVHRTNLQNNGRNPTLLYAYGGFEISETPGYLSTTGASWLERGGVYVVANIRGGGEFGPQWHQAGLKENRQRIYDDFAAVAKDLIAKGITSPQQLGIMGGSNGGLLVGVAYTQHPELYGAVAVRVPLFDMKRYNHLLAGASWMAEYGNPDVPEEWAYISKYSPYQNIKPGQPYPRVFFSTTTRDDRVHPGHARKGAAKMESLGYPVYYYENTEGGHGSGVTSEQRARMEALVYTYFWQQLGSPQPKLGT